MEYRILDEDIKLKGRISDKIGVIFGLGKVRRVYVLDLLGFGRSAKMENLNYY
jgi:UDP-N-acetylglucosamine transferase subunit ALG13